MKHRTTLFTVEVSQRIVSLQSVESLQSNDSSTFAVRLARIHLSAFKYGTSYSCTQLDLSFFSTVAYMKTFRSLKRFEVMKARPLCSLDSLLSIAHPA